LHSKKLITKINDPNYLTIERDNNNITA
jgi:hypothetical protein